MSIVETIVTALAAGALTAVQSTASQAVQDAYGAVKALIQRKYAKVHLPELEQQPESKAWRAVVEEELSKSGAASDDELLPQIQRLLDALANHAPAAQVIGVDLATIQGASLQIQEVIAQGKGSVTGVKGRNITTTGSITISGVTATQSQPAAQAIPPIKILFLAASPQDNVTLRTAEEARTIELALRQASHPFTLLHHGAVQVDDLQQHLLRHQPHIVHFSGHGSTQNAIFLQDAAGKSVAVQATALRDLFRLGQPHLRCVLLNACSTAPQAAAIAEVVDCVIGMSAAIRDDAAQLFAVAFYGALAAGQSVKTAFAAGCNRLDLSQLADEEKPVLVAPRVDPATLYFVAPKAE